MANNNHRIDSKSNAHVGRAFENLVQKLLSEKFNQNLERERVVELGVKEKIEHRFDLGSEEYLIECKAHRWTTGDNVPSAKLTVWNEAMLYFLLAPDSFKKILCVEKHYNAKKGMTLAEYYLKTYSHLIPEGVEIWEVDTTNRLAQKVIKAE